MKTKRKFTLALITLLAVAIAIQFKHPVIINSRPVAEIQVPTAVKAIFKRACYDCHSDETNLRWYDQIAPVYWQVAAHVKEGREGLNFSTMEKMMPAERNAKFWEAINQVAAGAMPLKSYAFVHRDAKVSTHDLAILKAYMSSLVPKNKAGDTAKINALATQLKNKQAPLNQLPVALNGINYMPDYKNWQVISTTDRFDNGTMRVIFANDIAVKAIQQNHIRPWPNGTILAKVAWDQLEDKDGNIKTGAFKQVEYMIKNDGKYAATKGWGFARFKTANLVPYGKTALFANECLNCHRPQKKEDFVFTQPVGFNDSHLKMMASFINKKSSTMSVLYTNGNTRTLVTWKQKSDENWFGANVPGKLQSIKLINKPNALQPSFMP
ncbi:heme-binding domain-containing protein [Mucilaginibacter sp. dw_454]|uniref:heme-binding domain-containing protein n=1 Tax=Mucilaginibacter sp. dw_454 TaxID=2720079 RepID=UPI001BD66AF1|nr:heme-binding domain-containing protein [Mucilaginibacter sp. dw_454]